MEQVKYVSKEDLRFAYEHSIQAYQKHVERYSTWMNMYAIMTGALFVAFYSIYGKDKMFLLLIAILGLLCSVCWYGAVKGHYEWMKSFIRILKFNEKNYFGKHALFVYSKVIVPQKIKDNTNKHLRGLFSTQKITLDFIIGVILAWICSIVMLDVSFIPLLNGKNIIVIFLFLCYIVYMCVCWIRKKYHSEILSEEVETIEGLEQIITLT